MIELYIISGSKDNYYCLNIFWGDSPWIVWSHAVYLLVIHHDDRNFISLLYAGDLGSGYKHGAIHPGLPGRDMS